MFRSAEMKASLSTVSDKFLLCNASATRERSFFFHKEGDHSFYGSIESRERRTTSGFNASESGGGGGGERASLPVGITV